MKNYVYVVKGFDKAPEAFAMLLGGAKNVGKIFVEVSTLQLNRHACIARIYKSWMMLFIYFFVFHYQFYEIRSFLEYSEFCHEFVRWYKSCFQLQSGVCRHNLELVCGLQRLIRQTSTSNDTQRMTRRTMRVVSSWQFVFNRECELLAYRQTLLSCPNSRHIHNSIRH